MKKRQQQKPAKQITKVLFAYKWIKFVRIHHTFIHTEKFL